MLHGGFGNLGLRARVAAAALAAAITLAAGSIAHAQEVAALVNGIPITQLDIAQRRSSNN